MNRGNAKATVFFKPGDFADFVRLIGDACRRLPMRVLAFCVMPNHFHLSLWPHEDGDLGRWMQWLMTAHVRRHHRRHGGSGHIWQGRFKAFPAQSDWHLLSVLRYIERNPLRANLVPRAEQWKWSSLGWRGIPGYLSPPDVDAILHPGPVAKPDNWTEWVNQAQTEEELAALRHSVDRGTPLGSDEWVLQIAERLGLESSLRGRGRPKKGDILLLGANRQLHSRSVSG